MASHRTCGSESGKGFHLETPRLIVGEMPVKRIDFKTRKQSNFTFQLLHGDKRAPRIVHKSAQPKRGPVSDFTAFHGRRRDISFSQLP